MTRAGAELHRKLPGHKDLDAVVEGGLAISRGGLVLHRLELQRLPCQRARRTQSARQSSLSSAPIRPSPPGARRSPNPLSRADGLCVCGLDLGQGRPLRTALSLLAHYPYASRTVSFVMMACMPKNCSFSKVSIDASWYIVCSVDRCSMEASNAR